MVRFFGWMTAALIFVATPARAGDEPSLLAGGRYGPNFLGATGIFETVTADTIGDRGVSAHAHFTGDYSAYGFLLGPARRVEVGATWLNLDDCFCDDGLLVNAKVRLLDESTALPGVAVGVIDLFDELDLDPSWYIVATKGLPKAIPGIGGLRLHLGVGGGIYDDEPFFGFEYQVGTPLDVLPTAKPNFSLLGEIRNGDFNIGLRGRFKGFSAQIALFDGDRFGGGVSYTTGLRLR